MVNASAQNAPPPLCRKARCGRKAAIPCPCCERAPSPFGVFIPSTSYCSEQCIKSDKPRHEADCRISRERQILFNAAKEVQDRYYTACEMDLNFAVRTGMKIGTDINYDQEALEKRMYTVAANKEFAIVFLACFGGHKPILSRRELISHLRGLNIRLFEMTLRMKRVRGFYFESPIRLAMDEHKVLKATTTNGESYALDIAGVQFGQHTAVVPWQHYVDQHVREIHGSEDVVFS